MVELVPTRCRGGIKFILGSLFGFISCYAWLSLPTYTSLSDSAMFYPQRRMLDSEGLQRPPETTGNHSNETSHEDDGSLADKLKSKIRILCFVPTGPKNHKSRASHVKATWGPRCNKLIFISSKKDKSLPTVVLPVKEGRDWLWRKTRLSLKYIYEHYADQYDWVLKADDDTYVIMENLRYLLTAYDPNKALFLGCRTIHKPIKYGFMYGGAGYVLSKKAVEKFVKEGMHSEKCYPDSPAGEDVLLSICLNKLGVEMVESRDGFERDRFFRQNIVTEVEPKSWSMGHRALIWYKGSEKRPPSNTAISFHKIRPGQMHTLDFLIYQLRPFGVTYPAEGTSVVPGGANISTILKKLL